MNSCSGLTVKDTVLVNLKFGRSVAQEWQDVSCSALANLAVLYHTNASISHFGGKVTLFSAFLAFSHTTEISSDNGGSLAL